MCGRYRLSSTEEEIAEFFEAEPTEELNPRYNIAPSQPVPVIRQGGSRCAISMVRWHLVLFWAQDPSIGSRLINGRSEPALDKPSFREPFVERRCLVPAKGFYEWKKVGQRKQPFHFGMKELALPQCSRVRCAGVGSPRRRVKSAAGEVDQRADSL